MLLYIIMIVVVAVVIILAIVFGGMLLYEHFRAKARMRAVVAYADTVISTRPSETHFLKDFSELFDSKYDFGLDWRTANKLKKDNPVIKQAIARLDYHKKRREQDAFQYEKMRKLDDWAYRAIKYDVVGTLIFLCKTKREDVITRYHKQLSELTLETWWGVLDLASQSDGVFAKIHTDLCSIVVSEWMSGVTKPGRDQWNRLVVHKLKDPYLSTFFLPQDESYSLQKVSEDAANAVLSRDLMGVQIARAHAAANPNHRKMMGDVLLEQLHRLTAELHAEQKLFQEETEGVKG